MPVSAEEWPVWETSCQAPAQEAPRATTLQGPSLGGQTPVLSLSAHPQAKLGAVLDAASRGAHPHVWVVWALWGQVTAPRWVCTWVRGKVLSKTAQVHPPTPTHTEPRLAVLPLLGPAPRAG